MDRDRWFALARRTLSGELLTKEDGLTILQAADSELLALLDAAFLVREQHFGKKVKLNMLINAKSGLCAENCGYCSQSSVSEAPVEKYSLIGKETLLAGAQEALARKAGTYCIATSGHGPTEPELEQVIEAVKEIRATTPLKICACLGFLTAQQAERLAAAGVHRYNHNLNTSAERYPQITSTHTFEQRLETVQEVARSGLSPCSGVIVGMGEQDEELVELASTLRELAVDSIPVNFLEPIAGTPLAEKERVSPSKALKVLALFRLFCPDREIRVAGGREQTLRSLQPLALYAANSLFVGGYLTTPGQEVSTDHQMIADLGFEIEER
ncbi:MAG: biotin synthase BioB [Cyanobacteria bacterium NC_groundwater_1444_Ag_S-0.65um_54_12]|nr:biotin synthase BioB [Cyanobacteria bacterium NC_groundwater_1444_Ag_S-0.65um_54_12]